MVVNDTPFNNPSASPALVEMWRNNLRKSQQLAPQPIAQPSVITINFDGAGVALVAGMAGLVEVTFPCRILGCHLFSGIMTTGGPAPIASTASVYLGLASQGSWATGSQPLYAGTMPSISASAEANVDTSGWILELQPGDLIPYGLVSFTGSATFLTLTLPVRRLDVRGIGLQSVDDGGGTAFTDGSGNEFTVRG